MSKPMPQNAEAERVLLGQIMREPLILDDCLASGLKPSHFHRPENGAIYGLLLGMADEGVHIDPAVTVPDRIMRSGPASFGGLEYVIGLADSAPSTANHAHYTQMIIKDGERRTVIGALDEARDELVQGLEDPRRIADRVIDSVYQDHGTTLSGGWRSLADIHLAVTDDAKQASEDPHSATRGISTGLRDLDAVIAKLQATDLTVLAARPGMGKTAMALNIAEAVARQRYPVGMFSLEMGDEQLGRRSLAGDAGVDGKSLRLGQINSDELARLESARQRLRDGSDLVFVDDTPSLTISEIRGRSRRLARQVGQLGLIVIDYIQLLGDELGPRASREREVAHASRGAKAIAKELECAVLLLSQLNRSVETTKDKRPQLMHLRESGAIEQDADQVIFLFRPGYYSPSEQKLEYSAEAIIAKNRHGQCKTIDLNFDGARSRFFNLSAHQLQHGGRP